MKFILSLILSWPAIGYAQSDILTRAQNVFERLETIRANDLQRYQSALKRAQAGSLGQELTRATLDLQRAVVSEMRTFQGHGDPGAKKLAQRSLDKLRPMIARLVELHAYNGVLGSNTKIERIRFKAERRPPRILRALGIGGAPHIVRTISYTPPGERAIKFTVNESQFSQLNRAGFNPSSALSSLTETANSQFPRGNHVIDRQNANNRANNTAVRRASFRGRGAPMFGTGFGQTVTP